MDNKKFIPMMRPMLVKAENLLPYLQRIDHSRWYTNFGPIVVEYEKRLSAVFGCHAVSTANCTSGLIAALLALDIPRGSHIVLPSWTFVATATAATAAGFIPYFLDVDEKTWGLTPEIVKRLGAMPKAVMPVSVFGAPVDTAAWDKFTEETGIPAVIDAAGAFDACSAIASSRPGKNPLVISTHATKVLGTGEGGMVLSTNKELVEKVRRITNFGFSPDRSVNVHGFNGKMSEYAAAVGMAALDEWEEKRTWWLKTKKRYLAAFSDYAGTSPIHDMNWVGSLFNIRLNRSVHPVIDRLAGRGVAGRQVWGEGCHRYKAYEIYPSAAMPVTDALVSQVLFVPYTIDISDEDLTYIAQSLKESLKERAA